MRILHKLLIVVAIAFLAPLLTGCTQEKAEALVTAIKSFESQSIQALNAYEQLFKEYGALEKAPPEEQFTQAYETVGKYGKDQLKFDEFVTQLGKLSEQQKMSVIERAFEQIKAAYSLLRSTYESLPAGSLLGAQYVSCGQMVTMKLTDQLVNFSLDVNRAPLYPISLRSKLAAFKNYAAKKDKVNAKKSFDALVAGINDYETKHAEAMKLTLAAVEQGRKVSRLLAQYDSTTVADILNVVQFGFSFLGTLQGVDVKGTVARLDGIKQEMEKSPDWQRVKDIPVATLAECKLSTPQ